MASFFRPKQSFLQNNAWQHQAKNALHYNTSQQGSVLPLIYGTCRQQVNLIDLKNYKGPKGKKGKTGSIPLSGTSQTGKGGGSSKGKGGKKSGHYSVDVDFALCQGPVPFYPGNNIFTSAGVEPFSVSGLHFYGGSDGQAPDSHFNQVGYSGTCHITGTPMDLGQSPVLPNVGVEITGFLTGTHTGDYVKDANPGDIVTDFLSNARYGAGFPAECVDRLVHDEDGVTLNTYGDYCQAASLLVSTSLDGHQKAIEWLNGLLVLTNSTMVWSGKLLKIVPYGDLPISNNGAAWVPTNFVHQYDLNDMDFLPWHPRQDGAVPTPGDDDPIMIMRSNPADADNWISMEYMDRQNFYNSTTITAYDQGAIDTYKLRIGDSLPGRAFCNQYSAQISIQLLMQRRLYIRNSQIKFQLGWRFALLEPMDMVTLTGFSGDVYLNEYPVRILSIEENDNGDLVFVCEDPQMGQAGPVSTPPPLMAARLNGMGHYLWDYGDEIINSGAGTLSLWTNLGPDDGPGPGSVSLFLGIGPEMPEQLMIGVDEDLSVFMFVGGQKLYESPPNTIINDRSWQHLLFTWDLSTIQLVKCWVNGYEVDNVLDLSEMTRPSTVDYGSNSSLMVFKDFRGDVGDLWFSAIRASGNPAAFRLSNNSPRDIGLRGLDIPRNVPDLYMRFSRPLNIDDKLVLVGSEPEPSKLVLY